MFNTEFDPAYLQLIEVAPGIRRMTARNPSAFTFKGTNTWVVGKGRVAVIDPGPNLAEHLQALAAALHKETVTHIVVTHTHKDHSPGASALQATLDAPLVGCSLPAVANGLAEHADDGGIDEQFQADIELADGDVLETEDWALEAVHTPGHLGDHLCFAIRETDYLVCGDHVMGWSTSIISPPGGHMGSYLSSLDKLLQRQHGCYLPGHGANIDNPHAFVEFLIAHRRRRETAVLRCVEAGTGALADMLPVVYQGLDKALYPAAARSLQATLDYLVEEQAIEFIAGMGIYQLSA